MAKMTDEELTQRLDGLYRLYSRGYGGNKGLSADVLEIYLDELQKLRRGDILDLVFRQCQRLDKMPLPGEMCDMYNALFEREEQSVAMHRPRLMAAPIDSEEALYSLMYLHYTVGPIAKAPMFVDAVSKIAGGQIDPEQLAKKITRDEVMAYFNSKN